MIRSLAFALCALALGGPAARADVVEIPLPALIGTYGPPSGVFARNAVFALPHSPAVVHAVSIRLRGSTQAGRMVCDGSPDPVEHDWNSTFFSQMVGSGPGGWVTDWCPTLPSSGDFNCTVDYLGWSLPPSPPPSWAFLADGLGELGVGIVDMNPLMCTELTEYPTGVVEEATLIVNVDFPVPARPRSWGAIKTIYR